MMSQEQNDLITRTGPKDACGKLMRMYWQPAALVDELEGPRPVRPVKLLGEDLVLFRDEQGRYGLIERALRASRRRPRLRAAGERRPALCLPRLAVRRRRAMPGDAGRAEGLVAVQEHQAARLSRGGEERHPLGLSRRGRAAGISGNRLLRRAATPTPSRSRATSNCNWLQALEVGIDPSHASFLHRFFEDEDTSGAYGRQFRGASAGSDMPMTKILREYDRPIINVEQTEYGFRLIALREIDEERTHVRVTNQLFPHGFVIPMSTEMTITQWHVPVDDENCYWYAIFTSYSTPVDKNKMRDQRLELYELPDYRSRKNRSNDYGFDPHEQATADLYRHGQRHQRARPVGGGVDGRDPGPHPRASRSGRQGHRAVPPTAAAGNREGRIRRASRSCSSMPRMRAASRVRPPWTASGRRGAGKPSGWRSTSSGGGARHGRRRCRRRLRTRFLT